MSDIRQKYAEKIAKKPKNTSIRTKGAINEIVNSISSGGSKVSGTVTSINDNFVNDGDVNEVEYMSNFYEKKLDSFKKKTMELPKNIRHISRSTGEKRHLSQAEKNNIATARKNVKQTTAQKSVSKRMKVVRRNNVANKNTGKATVKGGKAVAQGGKNVAKGVSKGVKVIGKVVAQGVKALAKAVVALVSSVGLPVAAVIIIVILLIGCVVMIVSGGSESGVLSDFIMPFENIKNVRVTDEYGWRTHPISGNQSFHSGIDFGTEHHCNILAVADGEVIDASINLNVYGFGKSVKIRHGDNLYSMYAHLSELKVRTGDIVRQGDVIGLEGGNPSDPDDYPTGASTGHHLHFEIYTLDRGVKVTTEPREYLPKGDFHPDDIEDEVETE